MVKTENLTDMLKNAFIHFILSELTNIYNNNNYFVSVHLQAVMSYIATMFNVQLGLAIRRLEGTIFDVSSDECLWEYVECLLESIDIDIDELREHYEAARTWANEHRRQKIGDGKYWYPMPLSWQDLEEGAPIDDILEALRNAHWFHICSLP
jgi:hypothetical protein